MKVVFFGTPLFSVPSLEVIILDRYHVPLVVTSPDKPRRSKHDISVPTPVKKRSLDFGLRVMEVDDPYDSLLYNTLIKEEPDVIVVVGFKILPKRILTVPRKGIFNIHASLLPKYRGAAPIQWAIINNEKVTGVTSFFLEEKVDTGAIILRKSLSIYPNETGDELSERLAILGSEVVSESLVKISKNEITCEKQDESMKTKAPKLTKQNTRINWERDARYVHNVVRALSQKPTAWTSFKGKTVKLYKSLCSPISLPTFPGKWRLDKERMFIGCGGNTEIEVLELQVEGKKRMVTREFVKGFRASYQDSFV